MFVRLPIRDGRETCSDYKHTPLGWNVGEGRPARAAGAAEDRDREHAADVC
jgi:hypothetical protein